MKLNKIPNISFVVEHDLCTGCGICVNSCVSKAIVMSVKKGRFLPSVNKENCKNARGCHRCLDTCPGIGVDLIGLSEKFFLSNDTKNDVLLGRYLKSYMGYSEDINIRNDSSSGGLVSRFLIWLLENYIIDGAVVTRFDKKNPLKVESFIATNKEDILSAKGSKYSPVSFHKVLAEVKESNLNRIVIVGLPCHIHGLRKFLLKDKKIESKIIGLFSLFCSGSQTINYTDYILQQCGGDINNLDYLAYREGSPTGMLAYGNGYNIFREYHKYNVPMKGIFYPRRCLLCVDMFGELADLSFGDIMIDDAKYAGSGIGAIIARDPKWLAKLLIASDKGVIHLEEISKDALLYKRPMAIIKKTRNASFVLMLKLFKKKVPKYDSSFWGKISFSICVHYFIMRIKQFLGNHKALWFLLPKIK